MDQVSCILQNAGFERRRLSSGTGRYDCSGSLENSTVPDPYCCSAAADPSPACCQGDAADERCSDFGAYFEGTFTRGKRHLLRLINSSTAAMFIFSIDAHKLRVISTDLVPIEPYETDSIFIGIGQRYEVVVDAMPSYEAAEGNYWMRTQLADLCGAIEQNSSTTGIVRYNKSSTAKPRSYAQHSRTLCKDEPLESLIPTVPWTIDSIPANAASLGDDTFQAGLSLPLPKNLTHGYIRWSLDELPFWLDFDHPTILGLDNMTYRPEQAVVPCEFVVCFLYPCSC